MPAEELLAWCDLETTGLEDQIDHREQDEGAEIVEVYFQITKADLVPVDEFHSLVRPAWAEDQREEWVKSWPYAGGKEENGLLAELRDTENIPDARTVAQEVCAFLAKHNKGNPRSLYIAGSTVKFDIAFLRHFMPSVLKEVHYRSVDVSSTRVQLALMFPNENWEFPKAKHHRAKADIEETKAEMKWLWEKAHAVAFCRGQHPFPWARS